MNDDVISKAVEALQAVAAELQGLSQADLHPWLVNPVRDTVAEVESAIGRLRVVLRSIAEVGDSAGGSK